MRTSNAISTLNTVLVFGLLSLGTIAVGQSATTEKVYRGSIGNSHIQMRLNIQGNNVTGTYFYDSVGEDLKLTGHLGDQGQLELAELGPKGKQTGKFICKRSLADEIDSECSWSKADGTREALVTLDEQYMAFTNRLQITPKTIANRKTGVGVSYPQITGGGSLSAGAQSFNRRILALVQEAIKGFAPIDGRGSFETNYNVLLGTDSLISIEMTEYYDGGGAHPNNRFWSLTYDLSGNKELKLEDLFNPNSDYKTAIANYVVADIDRRAAALEQESARSEGRKPKERDEPLVSTEQLSELSGWGMTPKGLVVYVDFPHVMAFFDRSFIPYSVVKEHFKPNGPAARLLNAGSPKGF
ncbi:MAG: hypothetical protein QOH42_1903 [Blastocatellia bacterium]|nr:hypothetical protein [Blastocatellia bacterium]